MSNTLAVLLEMGLVFGGVLGWLLWELFSVRRALKHDETAAVRPQHDSPHD
jgi:heme/copper-type cytochrome/quinol oxidase subunit 2